MNCDHNPDLRALQKIATALDTPVSHFFRPPDQLPLDQKTRHRIELSLNEMLKLTPTMSKSEMQTRIMDLLADLSSAKDLQD